MKLKLLVIDRDLADQYFDGVFVAVNDNNDELNWAVLAGTVEDILSPNHKKRFINSHFDEVDDKEKILENCFFTDFYLDERELCRFMEIGNLFFSGHIVKA
jgi:hypothetical protein